MLLAAGRNLLALALLKALENFAVGFRYFRRKDVFSPVFSAYTVFILFFFYSIYAKAEIVNLFEIHQDSRAYAPKQVFLVDSDLKPWSLALSRQLQTFSL